MAINFISKKYSARDRRKLRIRKKISGSAECPRFSVFKSSKHTYAQLIDDVSGVTICSASTLESGFNEALERKGGDSEGRSKSSKSVNAARVLGEVIGERALEKGVKTVVFDRNGARYTGRVKSVADGARDKGLCF